MNKRGKFEKKNRKKIRPLPWIILLICIGLLILGILAANHLQVGLTLEGDSEITLEAGTEFQDPGSKAYLTGFPFFKEPKEMVVQVSGKVDPAKPGDYELVYKASFLWHGEKATRTVHVVDTTPPVIELVQSENSPTQSGDVYQEEGYRAWDSVDGDLTDQVVRKEEAGKIIYTVSDQAGNTAQAVRELVDVTGPEITLKGEAACELPAGTAYEEPGFTAVDNFDGDVTDKVQVDGEVNSYRAGDYSLTYTVTDAAGNTTTVTRTVTVTPIPQPERIDPGDKIVYLTFDDGPGPYTKELLDVLDRYNVKVTFFVVDTGYDDTIGEEFRRGHTVGIHSATHSYSTIYASEDAYFEDLNRMSDIIYAQTGQRPTQVRFPGGSSNTVSCFNPGIMTRLTEDLNSMGYEYYDWNVLSGDAGETTDTAVVVQNVIDGIRSHNVSIVLQHDIKGFSVAAVEEILIWGLNNGYTFLPLTPGCPTAHHGLNN